MDRNGSPNASELVSSPANQAASGMKLFVGQVPRTFTERELFPVFSEFGEITELVVLRDRYTQTSKGCAFLTFATQLSAENCMAALHDKKTLGEMPTPLQVKPAATTRKAEDRKLFVGMLSKTLDEEEIKGLFQQYGNVEEVTVLRTPDGVSKGCAFVRMSSHECAEVAIASLHQSSTLKGCRAPLVVKFADNEREKHARRLQATQMEYYYPYPSYPQPGLSQVAPQMYYNPMPQFSSQSPTYDYPPSPSSHTPSPAHSATFALPPGAGMGQLHLSSHLSPQPMRQLGMPTSMHGPTGMPGPMGGHGMGGPGGMQHMPMYNPAVGPRPTEVAGPDNSNLFIYHLPQEYNDQTLSQLFSPFGLVLSAKVFIDLTTQQSKCFGFVSFDNPMSAAAAIEHMNGHQIGSKRLKVSLKKHRPPQAGRGMGPGHGPHMAAMGASHMAAMGAMGAAHMGGHMGGLGSMGMMAAALPY